MIESPPVMTALCTAPLMATEYSHAEEHIHDVIHSPNEETVTEVVEAAVTDVTSPKCEQDLEKSDSVPVVSASSSFVVSPESSALSSTVRETSIVEEGFEGPSSVSSVIPCSGSDVLQVNVPESSQTESQQSSLKRKHSTSSSLTDGGESDSEDGEIEV